MFLTVTIEFMCQTDSLGRYEGHAVVHMDGTANEAVRYGKTQKIAMKKAIAAALEERGRTMTAEWRQKDTSLEHCWGVWMEGASWESCRWCGAVRRADESNGKCKGQIGVVPKLWEQK